MLSAKATEEKKKKNVPIASRAFLREYKIWTIDFWLSYSNACVHETDKTAQAHKLTPLCLFSIDARNKKPYIIFSQRQLRPILNLHGLISDIFLYACIYIVVIWLYEYWVAEHWRLSLECADAQTVQDLCCSYKPPLCASVIMIIHDSLEFCHWFYCTSVPLWISVFNLQGYCLSKRTAIF